MKFDVNRMGEQYVGVNDHWVMSIVSGTEWRRIEKLKVGESITFKRDVTGPLFKQLDLVITVVSA